MPVLSEPLGAFSPDQSPPALQLLAPFELLHVMTALLPVVVEIGAMEIFTTGGDGGTTRTGILLAKAVPAGVLQTKLSK